MITRILNTSSGKTDARMDYGHPRCRFSRIILILAMLAFQLGPTASLVLANPSGEQVVAGGASFDRAGSTLTVNQGSDKVIINWQDFSIGAGELTKFIQPSATSAALNRVISQNVSEIYGTLEANGQIYLVNPNGLTIGPSGVINTQSFIASTHDVSNEEFLAGGDMTFRSTNNQQSTISNLGAISADGGDIILIANQVENAGTISAPDGTAALAAGSEVLVKASGEERIFIQAETSNQQSTISNSGLISAASAEIKAASGNEYALAINNSGVIRATSAQKVGGRIFLRAGGGKIHHSGTIAATSEAVGQQPEIQLLADNIEMAGEAVVDASGSQGGGRIHIGGSVRGEGPLPNASEVTIAEDVIIRADALGQGDGGDIVIYADGSLSMAGSVSARGGARGGNGGFIETSGKEFWSFADWLNRVDVSAPQGAAGVFLIDPIDTTILAGSSGGIGASPVSVNTLYDGDISAFLQNTGSLEVETNGSGGNGDVTFNANTSVTWNSGNSFTVNADRSILMNPGSEIISQSGGINLNANTAGTAGGNFAGITLDDATIRSGSGAIGMSGTGGDSDRDNYGIFLDSGSEVASNSGTITLTGTGGDALWVDLGIVVYTNSVVRTADGDMVLSGTGGNSSRTDTSSSGVQISGTLESTGSGKIDVTGTGRRGGGAAGIYFSGDIHSSGSGDIEIKGYSNSGGSAYNRPGIWLNTRSTGIRSTGSGDIHLFGQTANGSGVNGGIVAADGVVEATGSGDVTIEGASTGGAQGIVFNTNNYASGGAQSAAIRSHTGAIKFFGDTMNWDGNTSGGSSQVEISSSGSGKVMIRPRTTATSVGLAGGSGTLNLTAVELAKLSDGFSEIQIGDSTEETGNMTVNAATFQDPLLLRSSKNIILNGAPAVDGDFVAETGGDITVNSDIFYDSGSELRFMAMGDIIFNASVQNSKFGAVYVVAGWDGTTEFDPEVLESADVGSTTLFGNNDGSIFINSASGTQAVAVGTQGGTTGVFGYNLILRGSDDGDDRYAQLGWRAPDDNTDEMFGDFFVRVKNDITAQAGDGRRSYAQIGQGGGRSASTNIGDAYGSFELAAGGNLIFTSGGEEAYSQLGHGGIGAAGIKRGDIDITRAGDITFTGGDNKRGYSQLGHGGFSAGGNSSDDITIEQAGNLNFTAGDGLSAYAQLGHGGTLANGNHSGDIDITITGNATLTGQNTTDQYALIGHGDAPGDVDAGDTVSGDIMVQVGGMATLANAFIGHLIDNDGTYTTGDTFIGAVGDLTTDAASRFNSAPTGELRIYLLDPANDLIDTATLLNGTAHGAVMAPNNQGEFVFGTGPYAPGFGNFAYYTLPGLYNYIVNATEATNIENLLNGGSDVTLAFDLNQPTLGAILDFDGGTQFILVNNEIFYDAEVPLNLVTTGDITIQAPIQNADPTSGNINLVAGWDGTTPFDAATFAAADVNATTLFGNDNGSIMIGDGTQAGGIAVGSRSGSTNIFGYDVSLQAGNGGDGRFAQIGFQVSDGVALDGTDLDPTSPDGSNVDVTGGIYVRARGVISATGGDAADYQYNYAQIGHVGAEKDSGSTVEAAVDANLEIAAVGDVTFTGGSSGNNNAYAQLGHGGTSARGNYRGAITLLQSGNIIFTAGSGYRSHSQLGHGGYFSQGNHSGDITIGQAGNLNFMGGAFFASYAQLGHGGRSGSGNHSGAISIDKVGSVNFIAGSGSNSYAQLGNGGYRAGGNCSGAVTVTEASGLEFSGGDDEGAYSQLGHGGAYADGNHSGDIDVTITGDAVLTGQDITDDRYALIGHGDDPGDWDNGNTVSGDLTLQVGGNLSLANAFLGHLIDPDGTYTSGNTFVGVGTETAQQPLTADVDSGFFSAPLGTGELRFYIFDEVNNQIAAGASLNGSPAPGPGLVLNKQGVFPFGTGPYNVPGPENVAFYVPVPPESVTAPMPFAMGAATSANNSLLNALATILEGGTVDSYEQSLVDAFLISEMGQIYLAEANLTEEQRQRLIRYILWLSSHDVAVN